MCCIPCYRLPSGCVMSCGPKGTRHFFDIWHIGKSMYLDKGSFVWVGYNYYNYFFFNILCFCFETGVGKALDAASKERACEGLKLWRPALINHLYWTAASTPDGDPDMMEAKWKSIVSHVQDIHKHGTPAFPSCAHPPLEGEARNKEWLEPGTEYSLCLLMIFFVCLFWCVVF